MEVLNCKGCGRLYNYMGGQRLCPSCVRKLEDKFQEVKAYLQEYPNSTVNRVSEAMEVSTKQIRQWIREERLSVTTAGADGIVCEQCGAPIMTGRFCEKCKASMVNNLNNALAKPKKAEQKETKREGNRMRFLQ